MGMNQKIQSELDQAAAARAAGNEGKARVCARRAAGMAAREYLNRLGIQAKTASAYSMLNALAEFPDLDPELRRAALDLTRRVDQDFQLPAGMDLIAEARKLCIRLSAR